VRVALRRQLAGHQRRQGQHGALQRQLVPAADELEPAGRRLHAGLPDRAAALRRARGARSGRGARARCVSRVPCIAILRQLALHATELFFPQYRQVKLGGAALCGTFGQAERLAQDAVLHLRVAGFDARPD